MKKKLTEEEAIVKQAAELISRLVRVAAVRIANKYEKAIRTAVVEKWQLEDEVKPEVQKYTDNDIINTLNEL
jgi:hypothetical protein